MELGLKEYILTSIYTSRGMRSAREVCDVSYRVLAHKGPYHYIETVAQDARASLRVLRESRHGDAAVA